MLTLTYKERNLIEPCPAQSRYHGSTLAPWPNRIADGKYQFNGSVYNLVINESLRQNSLHGLVDTLEWEIVESDDTYLHLRTILESGPGYPSTLLFNSSFSLERDGLHWNIRAENIGRKAAPYGVSIHPYLLTGSDITVNEFTVKFKSNYFMEVDGERLLPVGVYEVTTKDFDFNNGLTVGERFIDHAFQIPSEAPLDRIEVTDSHGVGSFMQYDSKARWIQIHTADRDGGIDSRRSLAVEPMSCPPDAFNSGLDLVILNPSEQHEMSWIIGSIN